MSEAAHYHLCVISVFPYSTVDDFVA